MPYVRKGKRIYKIGANGRPQLIKEHKTEKEARDHLTALNINVRR